MSSFVKKPKGYGFIRFALSYETKVGSMPKNSREKPFTFKKKWCIMMFMKIWAKLMEDGRIKKQIVYEKDGQITYSQFFEYLTEICFQLDIPTPVLTKTHIFNFAKFNHVKFIRRDFVDALGYDCLFLENLF